MFCLYIIIVIEINILCFILDKQKLLQEAIKVYEHDYELLCSVDYCYLSRSPSAYTLYYILCTCYAMNYTA